MKTLVCTTPGKLEYRVADKPVVTKGNAILKIKRVGICGTDLHAYEGTQPYFNYPRILGHEIAAEIVDIDDAPGFEKGEKVTFIPYFNCGFCVACHSGKPNCCVSLKVCGVHIDGGMAEYLSVPSYSLVHGEGLSYDELAFVEPLAIGSHGVARCERINYLTEVLPEINIPTLVIVGREDEFTPVAKAEELQETLQNCKLIIIEDAGHMPNLEQPEHFNKAVLAFLGNIDLYPLSSF